MNEPEWWNPVDTSASKVGGLSPCEFNSHLWQTDPGSFSGLGHRALDPITRVRILLPEHGGYHDRV